MFDMLVLGYRGSINTVEVTKSIKKHTNYNSTELKKIVSEIELGNPVNLPNDFVLREELENLSILIQ